MFDEVKTAVATAKEALAGVQRSLKEAAFAGTAADMVRNAKYIEVLESHSTNLDSQVSAMETLATNYEAGLPPGGARAPSTGGTGKRRGRPPKNAPAAEPEAAPNGEQTPGEGADAPPTETQTEVEATGQMRRRR